MISGAFFLMVFIDPALSGVGGIGEPSFVASYQMMLGSIGATATAFLGEIMPSTAPSSVGAWLQNLLYVAGVIFFLVAGIKNVKELFGRTTPITAELRTLEKEMREAVEHQDKRRASNTRDLFDAIEQSKQDLGDRIGKVERIQDVLDERTKSTNHKIDSVETKVDRLLSGRKGIP